MKFSFTPIGFLKCNERFKAEQPRQGIFCENSGVIELEKHKNYEQALKDLAGFERIWLVFVFDRNENWKPLVQPPFGSQKKRGVFATRSPHRPNNIGLSCVTLEHISGRELFIRNFDLLDNTPILDIKPYIPVADSFPASKTGWLNNSVENIYNITINSEVFTEKYLFIKEICALDLYNFCRTQLANNPENLRRKRLKCLDEKNRIWEISCRTWRVQFTVNKAEKQIYLNDIKSNYSEKEAHDLSNDPYKEKEFHIKYFTKFS